MASCRSHVVCWKGRGYSVMRVPNQAAALPRRRVAPLARVLSVALVVVHLGATAVTAEVTADAAGAYDRRSYYSQPMGQSAWKRPPASVEAFAAMLEQGKLNATPAQYAEALHEAGWIESSETAAAMAFIRGLRKGTVPETKQYRMGRMLRSYRTRERALNSQYAAVIRAGEEGFFTADGALVLRTVCLNVVYPERRVAVLPAREEQQAEVAPPPVAAPVEPEAPIAFAFNPPPPFEPPVREIREPVSPSVP